MQKLFLIWFAICIAGLIVFNTEYDFTAFINNFNSIGRFTDIIRDEYRLLSNVSNTWQIMRDTFLNMNNLGDFFKGVLYFFGAVSQVLVLVIDSLVILPVKIVIYLFRLILNIMPLEGGVNVL